MIVIVTGGRDYADRTAVFRALSRLKIDHGNILVMQGECPTGADRWAREWSDENGYVCVGFHPPWKRLNLGAGPARNRAMARLSAELTHFVPHVGRAICLHFPGGRGTKDMIEQAGKFGIELVDGEDLCAASPQS